jgi:hypothetical protein
MIISNLLMRQLLLCISLFYVLPLLVACPPPGDGDVDSGDGDGDGAVEFVIDSWDQALAFAGNTLFADARNNRVVEIEMDGAVAWGYDVPGTNSLTDVEYLANGNILFAVKGEGVYEIDRDKTIAWSFTVADQTFALNVWHDADRLANGNTLITTGNAELNSAFPYDDPQVIEIDIDKNVVWEWYAKDHYSTVPPAAQDILADRGDWTHVNGAQRLADGSTLISIRNFDLIVIVDTDGTHPQGNGTLGLPSFPMVAGFPCPPLWTDWLMTRTIPSCGPTATC